jgi:uncharacterized membrane protein YfcA
MFELHSREVLLIGITLVAAVVNGGMGYGFSSITVPAALLFYSNRELNPALVLVEVGINLIVFFANRRALARVFPLVAPLLLGAMPGVLVGTFALSSVGHGGLKLATYGLLLPLILAQSAGWRRPLRRTRTVGASLGAAIGLLYAATTISGPPLALHFNNEGLAKDDFRAAISLFRIFESTLTALTYGAFGLYTVESLPTAGLMVPSISVGLPAGYLLLRRFAPETFRRTCMGLDALLVTFGLVRTLGELHLVGARAAQGLLAFALSLELILFTRFFRARAPTANAAKLGRNP